MKNGIDFSKLDGLIPAVIQDADTDEVLMVGFMNEESYAMTLTSGYVTFFSRGRQKLWTKGETSGNTLQVIEVIADCDLDTVLIKAKLGGDKVCCHTGSKSCFINEIKLNK